MAAPPKISLRPGRQRFLAAGLAELDRDDSAEQERQQRIAALRKQITDLRARQDRQLDELEAPPDGMDDETYRAFRQRLHERFSDLTKQLKVRHEDTIGQPADLVAIRQFCHRIRRYMTGLQPIRNTA